MPNWDHIVCDIYGEDWSLHVENHRYAGTWNQEKKQLVKEMMGTLGVKRKEEEEKANQIIRTSELKFKMQGSFLIASIRS